LLNRYFFILGNNIPLTVTHIKYDSKKYHLRLVAGGLPHPRPLSGQQHWPETITIVGRRGVCRGEGASPPLQIQPPLKQTGKRALKKDLFERGPDGDICHYTKEIIGHNLTIVRFSFIISSDV
jgi:hypothetical protein